MTIIYVFITDLFLTLKDEFDNKSLSSLTKLF